MSTTIAPTVLLPTDWSVADLQHHLGDIPVERIRLFPPPGMATEQEVVNLNTKSGRICELIDGVLVEKTMGWYESQLAGLIIHLIHNYLDRHDLGIVLAPDGMLRILPGQVRIPDISFISWDKFPDRKLPRTAIASVAPDLAIEVLSPGNTSQEMDRKLRDYFQTGVRLVWYIDADLQTARAYRAVEKCEEIPKGGVLNGGEVLPGFELSLAELFEKAGPRE